jgi:hypothetical protein
MTDKEIFDGLKAGNRKNRSQMRMLKYLQADINRQLLFTHIDEDRRIDLLAQLSGVETNKFKIRRNKFNSSAYEFNPVNRQKWSSRN